MHFISPCCFGENLAAWLGAELAERDVETSEPFQEDCVWELPARCGEHSYCLGICGNADEPGALGEKLQSAKRNDPLQSGIAIHSSLPITKPPRAPHIIDFSQKVEAVLVNFKIALHNPRRHMRFEAFSFGSIQIDGTTYDHDVVIDCGEVRKRKKKPSKKFRDDFGHTPLSAEERIPWKCHRLVIGTGGGALPVMDEVKKEAQRRKVELRILPTVQAIELLKAAPPGTNAILHVTC